MTNPKEAGASILRPLRRAAPDRTAEPAVPAGLVLFRLHVSCVLEWQIGHEVGVVDDVGLGGALDEVAFGGVGGDDVADVVADAAFECQSNSGEGMAEGFSALTLAALAVGAEFVFEQFSDVGEDSTGDDGIYINGQSAAHEFVHGFGALARDMDDAALVLHKSDGAVGDEQGEGYVVEVVGFQRTALQGFDPGLGDLLAQLGVFDPLNFRPKPDDGVAHTSNLR